MSLSDRLVEFEQNLWNHSEDEFQLSFDEPTPLTSIELSALGELVEAVRNGDTVDELAAILRAQIRRIGEAHCFLLLQLCGLTRNKILTDLRAASKSGAKKVNIPSSHLGIVANNDAWAEAGPYLVRRLQPILSYLADYENSTNAFQAISLATWPGFIRQERAKRQGHEAEARLARVLQRVGIPFEPAEKAHNPMCRDIIIFDLSFDLVVPAAASPKACFKATVHTSNIGQYGESKDHLEMAEARRMIDTQYAAGPGRPVLLALIDGIGFKSNRAGLEGVLSEADEFCQFQTLWKAVVLCAAKQGTRVELALPPGVRRRFQPFLDRWMPDQRLFTEFAGTDPGPEWVEAGSGFVKACDELSSECVEISERG